jgi:hypothetical protein
MSLYVCEHKLTKMDEQRGTSNGVLSQLKPDIHPNNIYKFSSYPTGNTLRLRYKAQPVNAV